MSGDIPHVGGFGAPHLFDTLTALRFTVTGQSLLRYATITVTVFILALTLFPRDFLVLALSTLAVLMFLVTVMLTHNTLGAFDLKATINTDRLNELRRSRAQTADGPPAQAQK